MRARTVVWSGVIVGLALILWGCQGGAPATPGEVRTSTETVDTATASHVAPLDVVVVLDHSGSMTGSARMKGNDPQGLRVEACKYLVNTLAKRPQARVGVVAFGTTAEIDSPMVPVKDQNAANALNAKLAARNMGDTHFDAALESTLKCFADGGTFGTNARPMVIVFTDGEPDDGSGRPPEQLFPAIEQRIKEQFVPKKCAVHVIGLNDEAGMWAKSQPTWAAILGENNVATISDVTQLRRVFQRIINPEMQVDSVTAAGVEFEVAPYTDTVELHIFPTQAELALVLERPDGTVVDQASGPDVRLEAFGDYQVMTVAAPAPGKWKYRVAQGDGVIEVYRNPIPVQVQVKAPAPSEPLGRPMKPVVSLTTHQGAPVQEQPEYPIRVVARITPPGDGAETVDVLLEKQGDSDYAAKETLPLDTPGKWDVQIVVSGGHEYEFASSYLFDVVEKPYLVVEEPGERPVPLGTGVPVRALVLVNGQPVNPGDWIKDPPLNLVVAQIKGLPGGGDSEAVFLNPVDGAKEGAFEAFIPAPLQIEGNARLALRMRGVSTRTEEKITDVLVVPFAIAKDNGQILRQRVVMALAVAGAVFALLVLTCLVWYLRLPKNASMPTVEVLFDGEPIATGNLSGGRRLVSIAVRRPAAEKGQELEGYAPRTLPKRIFIAGVRSPQYDAESGEMPEQMVKLYFRLPGVSQTLTAGTQLPLDDHVTLNVSQY